MRGKSYIYSILAVVMALLLAALLYGLEFSTPIADEALEAAIRDYNFTTEIDVDVLARQAAGKQLFVLYAQQDHEGWGGLAELERGLFGGWRFRSCKNFDGQLYRGTVIEGKQPTLLLYGLHDLPGVARYEVYCGDEFVNSGDTRLETAPFLQQMSAFGATGVPEIRYFASDGEEITHEELKAQIPLADGGSGSATYTAEAGMIYVLMALIVACGMVIAGILVPGKWKKNHKKQEEAP